LTLQDLYLQRFKEKISELSLSEKNRVVDKKAKKFFNQYKIDAPNRERLEYSVEEIRNSLTEGDKAKFNKSFDLIIHYKFREHNFYLDNYLFADEYERQMKEIKKIFHRKTPNDIIAEAKKILRALIEEYEKDQEKAESLTPILNKVEITKPRIYIKKSGKTTRYFINATLKNNINYPLYYITITTKLTNSDKSKPILVSFTSRFWPKPNAEYVDDMNVMPGEEIDIDYHIYSRSTVAASDIIEIPLDAMITIEVKGFNARGKNISKYDYFSPENERHLLELKRILSWL